MVSSLPNFWQNRWLSLAAATWLESCVGVGSGFGLWSQTLKSTLGYNQQQLATIAAFKDLGGNVGVIAGLVADIAPPWAVLLIGALVNSAGYLALWLALSGRMPSPGFWQLAFSVLIASNGANWLNTAGMVTMVKSFPTSSGFLLGYIKGFIGLSAAMYVQIYSATVAPKAVDFLLLAAIVPSTVAVLVMPFIHLRPAVVEATEPESFILLAAGSAILAAYLFTCSFMREAYEVNKLVSREMVAGMLVLLSLPILVALREQHRGEAKLRPGGGGPSIAGQVATGDLAVEFIEGSDDKEHARVRKEGGEERGGGQVPIAGESSTQSLDSKNEILTPLLKVSGEQMVGVSEEPLVRGQLAAAAGLGAGTAAVVGGAVSSKHPLPWGPLKRGEEHSLLQAFATLDYWLMFTALVLGCGSSLAVSDNLGQIALVLGYEPGIFISLFSIAAFLGLMVGGYLSEHMLRTRGWPRPIFGGITFLILLLGHLVLASGLGGCVHVGAMTVGFSYGSIWAIMPAVISDLFGFKAFASLYNWLIMANPCGSYLLSVWVTGRLYDIEVEKEKSDPSLLSRQVFPDQNRGESTVACHGPHCFRLALLVLAIASGVGSTLCFLLTVVSRRCYQRKFNERQQSLGRLA